MHNMRGRFYKKMEFNDLEFNETPFTKKVKISIYIL